MPQDTAAVEQNKYGKWRTYKWGLRPDHADRTPDDKEAWLLDSEHETEKAAQDRANQIRNDAKRTR
jgi:hypothetical protein